MNSTTVTFANVYESAVDADFLLVWNPSDTDLRGYVPLVGGSPKFFMNNTLELIRESSGDVPAATTSFVVRNPSHLDAAIGIVLYELGTPDDVPKTEALELFQNGVKVQARIHIFPAPSPKDCNLVVQSTPSAQWQTDTNLDRNYKHVTIFSPKLKVEDWACILC